MPFADPARAREYEQKRAARRKTLRRTDPTYQAKERDAKRRNRYGLTQDELAALYAQANGRCELCDKESDYLHVDHDHETGRVRGLLCAGCNTTLHWVERTDWLRKAQVYVGA
jgi:hypothetical protein